MENNLEVLYTRPVEGGMWEPVLYNDDPNTIEYSIHDIWDQDICEVSIDGDDYVISDYPY